MFVQTSNRDEDHANMDIADAKGAEPGTAILAETAHLGRAENLHA